MAEERLSRIKARLVSKPAEEAKAEVPATADPAAPVTAATLTSPLAPTGDRKPRIRPGNVGVLFQIDEATHEALGAWINSHKRKGGVRSYQELMIQAVNLWLKAHNKPPTAHANSD